MPIPKPKKGEKRQEFINKCMSDEVMTDEFPSQKQRAAICFNQMKRAQASDESLDWEDHSDDIFIIY
ncbi:hypothetical protein OAE97_01515 [Verrucomicrobia bacterium]|nr:hypothetical protein [Verrucomicrobiota bacterium]